MTSPVAQLKAALAGRYDIEREIGAGGMATVYLARDVKHDRRVAVKVLNPELGAVVGAERFLAEIRVTANLQHPNLLPLFDSGEAGGLLFYVMPFVEGESLRARLDRERQLPIDEALRITIAVAGALNYAHKHGVIHRDLKPENVLLHEGQPLVADFGIALAVAIAGGNRITQTGLSLGTPHYMSPEQATGERNIDGRTDIYSLGALTYEMLAGEPPHTGATSQAIVAKLMTEEARPVSQTRRSVPAHIDEALARALAKLPADRWSTAAEFAHALEQADGMVATRSHRVSIAASAKHTRYIPWAIAALGVALASFALARPSVNGSPLVVSSLMPPAAYDFSEAESFGALSPDGRQFAFVTLGSRGETRLWVRRLDSIGANAIPETEGASSPFWSPDGKDLAYFRNGVLLVASMPGGVIRRICQTPSPYAGSWSTAGTMAVATSAGIVRVRTATDTCDLAIKRDTFGFDFRHPALLPDGRHVLFTDASSAAYAIAIGDLETGEVAPFLSNAQDPEFVAPGTLVFASGADGNTKVVAQRFNPRSLKLVGEPVPLSESVRTMAGVAAYAVARGALLYLPGTGDSGQVLTDRSGVVRDTLLVNGTWTHQWARNHLWIAEASFAGVVKYDVERGLSERLRTMGSGVYSPTWAPGDTLIAYGSCRLEGRCGIGMTRLTDDSAVVLIRPDSTLALWPSSWSPDGRYLLYSRTPPGFSTQDADIWTYDFQRKQSQPLIDERFSVLEPSVSPNGQWLAYRSHENGAPEVYVRPFQRTGATQRVSRGGGRLPRWRSDGLELFYQDPDGRVLVSDVKYGPPLSISTPRVLLNAAAWTRHNFHDIGTSYDVSHDGKWFAFRITPTSHTAVLVQNWHALLK